MSDTAVSIAQPQAIEAFLRENCAEHLKELYHAGMEVQVNPSSFGLEKQHIYKDGKKTRSWYYEDPDGKNRRFPIRIPWNSKTGPPEYDLEKRQRFSLEKFAEAIGLTGWNWITLRSMWVAFDLDSVLNHEGCGVSDEEMERIVDALKTIPWVTIWRSKSGHGYHFIVFIKNSPEVKNHTEHSAIAKAILNHLSALTGINLNKPMDACGTVHFIWHRETGERGFELIQEGVELEHIPNGWQALLEQRLQKRRAPIKIEDDSEFDKVDTLNTRTPLDYKHRELIHELNERGFIWWWDADNWLLVCHTCDLEEIHKSGKYKGAFSTSSSRSTDQNCFMFPMPNGAWIVRRYGEGVNESDDWHTVNGWAVAYFNRLPSITEVLNKVQAGRDGKKWLLNAKQFKKLLSSFQIPGQSPFGDRQHRLSTQQDTFIVKVRRENTDDDLDTEGWLLDGNTWNFNSRFEVVDYTQHAAGGEIIRVGYDRIKGKYRKYIWNQQTRNWREACDTDCRDILAKEGIPTVAHSAVMGEIKDKGQDLISVPFAAEHLEQGWNKEGPKLAFQPNYQGDCFAPTWDKIFSHIGKTLTPYVQKNEWCKQHGIRTGGHWCKLWTAFLFREPWKKNPYLFLYSLQQNTGKTTFKDALKLLMINGHVDCAAALQRVGSNGTAFAGELLGKVLGYVEEVDLGRNSKLYDKLKTWITDEEIQIEFKGGTPILARNYLHFVHTAQSPDRAPVGAGDTRIQMIEVTPLGDQYIDSDKFRAALIEEAPDFLAEIMGLTLPPMHERLSLQIINTQDRQELMMSREEDIDAFLRECCYKKSGTKELLSDLYEAFVLWLAQNNVRKAPAQRTFKALLIANKIPVGKLGGKLYVGNLTRDPKAECDGVLVQTDYKLIHKKGKTE